MANLTELVLAGKGDPATRDNAPVEVLRPYANSP